MINRILEQIIRQYLPLKKILVILGAHQVGKSSLMQMMYGGVSGILWLNGEHLPTQHLFNGEFSADKFKSALSGRTLVIIDEAQNIENIGLKLKQIADNLKDVAVIATGSSSFDLANKVNEPLTGRKIELQMYPLSFAEMAQHGGLFEEKAKLEHRLVYGYYPEIVTSPGSERVLLNELASSYLYKDILKWENIKKNDRIDKLLQAIAFQVGSMVSYTELGNLCGLDNKTVEKYITLLEKAFVVFRLPSFSNNLRNEIKFGKKIYFYDNGIRNAIISNFNPISLRQDSGALWENFMIAERMKRNGYKQAFARSYFWRNQAQSEIDYIEEIDGNITAYEFKFSSKRKVSIPAAFAKAYPNAGFNVITPDNFEQFVV